MGSATGKDATLHHDHRCGGDNYWTGVFVGRFGPTKAAAINDLLEELGLRPYESAKPKKKRAEQSAVNPIRLPGQ
jgi:hypothetical protein